MKKQVTYSTETTYRPDTTIERQENRRTYDRILLGSIAGLVLLVVVLCIQMLSSQADALTKAEKPDYTLTYLRGEEKTLSDVMAVATDKVEKASESNTEAIQGVTDMKSTFNSAIPMPKEHQEYLYELTQKYGLDYKKTLAVIQHESVFDPNATNATNDFGYFQINQVNHETLAETLQTENNPFNPYVNMQWGTYMLSDLYSYWSEKGYHGQGLDDAVWSSYNRGKTGFLENGHAVTYVNKMKASIETINSKF